MQNFEGCAGDFAITVDKLEDYRDEVERLKAQSNKGGPPTPPPAVVEQAPTPPPQASGTYFPSRFGASLFGSRRPSPAVTPASAEVATTPGSTSDTQSSRRESDLQAALNKEQEARRTAEGKVSQMSQEVEDLSVQLFQQANEMVANERKARAKLEERVELLEKRDTEKRKRLERLENALNRIERVRGLLAPPAD